MWKNSFVPILLLLAVPRALCSTANCKMNWEYSKDNKKQPLLVSDNELWFPSVTEEGEIFLTNNEKIKKWCPNDRPRVVDIQCLDGVLQYDPGYDPSNPKKNQLMYCNNYQKTTAVIKELGGNCYNNHKMKTIGFELDNKFFPLYEVCHNKVTSSTFYSHNKLGPWNKFKQPRVKYSFNQKAGLNHGYKFETQKKNYLISNYIRTEESEYFLNRGHLSPRADFVFPIHQEASYYFINIAPQWKIINSGNWDSVENELREAIKEDKRIFEVYTGTWGVLCKGDKPVYLFPPGRLVVPKFFYKVVYEPISKMAVVFVTINDPYLTKNDIRNSVFVDSNEQTDCRSDRTQDGRQKIKLCSNIIANLQWKDTFPSNVNWGNPEFGFTYVCEWKDFSGKVKHLNGLNLKVKDKSANKLFSPS